MTVSLPESLSLFRGKPFFEFGMLDAKFSLDERDPVIVITIGHCTFPGSIVLTFNKVVYHAVMSESYVYLYDEDEWVHELFLAEANSSQLIQHLSRYTLLAATFTDLLQLRHFRVICQNFFVEIVATVAPEIELR